jgi:hypothetical protein
MGLFISPRRECCWCSMTNYHVQYTLYRQTRLIQINAILQAYLLLLWGMTSPSLRNKTNRLCTTKLIARLLLLWGMAATSLHNKTNRLCTTKPISWLLLLWGMTATSLHQKNQSCERCRQMISEPLLASLKHAYCIMQQTKKSACAQYTGTRPHLAQSTQGNTKMSGEVDDLSGQSRDAGMGVTQVRGGCHWCVNRCFIRTFETDKR